MDSNKRLLDADAIIVAAYHNRNIKTYPAAYPGVLVSGRIVMVFWEMVKFCFKNKRL